jgi:hypothetical protein
MRSERIELKELRELTGDESGAQRVAWTETWETARACVRDKVPGHMRRTRSSPLPECEARPKSRLTL